ncbi:MAG: hypothetical protein KBG22_12155 [Smithella sp.]|nr:hypothetical protein [Smithella sp.]
MKSIAIIVPALEKNAYHAQGDMAPFGDVSLLEWKLSQVCNLLPEARVYVSTPSDTIAKWCQQQGVSVIRRDANLTLSEMITTSVLKTQEPMILWTYVTSPFIGAADYRVCIKAFAERKPEYDSLLTTILLKEYVLYQGHPVNFQLHEHSSRREIEPVMIMTNGCSIIMRESALDLCSTIGRNPIFFPVDRLTAMEIKDMDDLDVANDLLARYIRVKELT